MEECYLKEKINSLRNEMNHVWGATFIIGGGTFGLSIIENKTVWIITLIICIGERMLPVGNMIHILQIRQKVVSIPGDMRKIRLPSGNFI